MGQLMSDELVINVSSGIIGSDLGFVDGWVNISISDGIIQHIGRGKASGRNVIELGNSVAMPPLANLHVHILDYVMPEVGWELDLDDLVGDPYGVKYRVLSKSTPNELRNAINRFLKHSWMHGVGFIAEFREGGLSNALLDFNSRPETHLVLGMPVNVSNAVSEFVEMVRYVDGLAISSPLYYNEDALKELSMLIANLGVQVHVHISETRETREEGDLEYLLRYLRPNAIVHGTFLSRDELELLKELNIPLIICPRSNYWFIGRLPNIRAIYELGLEVGIGSDNACWIKCDLWRDLELLSNVLRPMGLLNPKWVLKAAVNSGIIGINNYLVEGGKANLLVINSELTSINYSKDKYLALIKRGGPEVVELLMVNGKVRHCNEGLKNRFRELSVAFGFPSH